LKKKLKKLKYKKNKKNRNKKISSNIRMEYINEGHDKYGFPISNKIKSPFPEDIITISNIKYKCLYYTFFRPKKEIKLYLERLDNSVEEVIIYDYYEFEKILLSIYDKQTVYNYF
jgi:hypothetical protein